MLSKRRFSAVATNLQSCVSRAITRTLEMFSINECRKLIPVISDRQVFSIVTRHSAMSGSVALEKPVETSIRDKLTTNLSPVHLDVINESYKHRVPKGSETHFKVVVVSDKFENVSLVQRHRMVNKLLQFELDNGVHALSIVARTPTQWNEDNEVEPSPKCMGSKK